VVVVVVIVVVVVVSQQDGQQHPILELKNKKTSPDFQRVNNFNARFISGNTIKENIQQQQQQQQQ